MFGVCAGGSVSLRNLFACSREKASSTVGRNTKVQSKDAVGLPNVEVEEATCGKNR